MCTWAYCLSSSINRVGLPIGCWSFKIYVGTRFEIDEMEMGLDGGCFSLCLFLSYYVVDYGCVDRMFL